MNFLTACRLAFGCLWAHKLRSSLASLGIILGISAIIAMTAAGAGARGHLRDRLETVGSNLILVRSGTRSTTGMAKDLTPLSRDDATAIRKQVGSLLTGVAEFQLTVRLATTGLSNWRTTITGCTPDMQKVREWKLLQGRYFSEEDLQRGAAVCVIGQTVRRKLFTDQAAPLGAMIRIGEARLHVIGILAEKGRNPAGGDQDDEIFVPITTFQRQVAGTDRIDVILAAARHEALTEQAMVAINQVLRERHKVKQGAEDFDVSSVAELAELGFLVTDTLQMLVAVIASISLLVGGIGIMNIMLASVKERTREIGTRLALGATPGDVLTQFVLEAVVIALIGGIMGVLFGVGAAAGIGLVTGLPVAVSPEIVLLAFTLTAGVGVFFGFYPAWRASRLDPIIALRYES
jgi:putative ABC transport system permease protein